MTRLEFSRKNIKENLPLIIINFDGLIGDFTGFIIKISIKI